MLYNKLGYLNRFKNNRPHVLVLVKHFFDNFNALVTKIDEKTVQRKLDQWIKFYVTCFTIIKSLLIN